MIFTHILGLKVRAASVGLGVVLAMAAAVPAEAATPTYTESYTFNTAYTLSNIITANQYVDNGSGITQAYFDSYGPGLVTLTDPFLKENNISQTYFLGTSSLSDVASAFSAAAIVSPNHLVLALNPVFAATALGTSFEATFGTTYSEDDVVGALNTLYNSGSDDSARNAAGSILFGFSSEVYALQAGTSASAGPLTLVAFSDGQAIGTGFASLTNTVSGAVPEPASWAMMIGGVGMIGGMARRNRRVARRGVLA